MNHSKHVLFFGGITASLCVFGAIALAFAPGNNEQAINTLLGTALPAGIAAAAGAFQSGNREDNSSNTSIIGTDKLIEADSYTLSQGKLQPNNSVRSQELMPFIEPEIREDWVDEEYR